MNKSSQESSTMNSQKNIRKINTTVNGAEKSIWKKSNGALSIQYSFCSKPSKYLNISLYITKSPEHSEIYAKIYQLL